jgi:hypothetical protein
MEYEGTEQPIAEAIAALMQAIRESERCAKVAAELINRGPGGREVALAITNMQQARHWVDEATTVMQAE